MLQDTLTVFTPEVDGVIFSLENDFIEKQIRTEITCENDKELCEKTISSSICHPLGFCYCPDGFVLTTTQNVTSGKTSQRCQPGEGSVNTAEYCHRI